MQTHYVNANTISTFIVLKTQTRELLKCFDHGIMKNIVVAMQTKHLMNFMVF